MILKISSPKKIPYRFLLTLCLSSLFFGLKAWAIYNGKPIEEDSPGFRSQVKLYYKKNKAFEFGCSGVLIQSNVVLTAGHCLVDDDMRTLQLRVGFDPISSMRSEIRVPAEATYLHPRYESHLRRTVFDLGIIVLKRSAPQGYVPAPVLNQPELFSLPARIHISGSGFYGFKDPLVGFLKKSNLWLDRRHTIDRVASSMNHRPFDPYKLIYPSEVGAVSHPDGSVCPGDSGGPHYALIQGRWQVVGISSSTTNNCLGGKAEAVFIGGYLNWVEATLRKHFRVSTGFGFSQDPQSEEWRSNVFPQDFRTPNSARNPHYECRLSETARAAHAPRSIDISLIALKPSWRASRKKEEYLFHEMRVDIRVEKDSAESYFTGVSREDDQILAPFQEQSRIDFEYYPDQIVIDFAAKRNEGNFQIHWVDQDMNQADYACVRRRPFSGQLTAAGGLRFFNQDTNLYSALAAGGRTCDLPSATTVRLQDFSFDPSRGDSVMRISQSLDQGDAIPSCLHANPFLVHGVYEFHFDTVQGSP